MKPLIEVEQVGFQYPGAGTSGAVVLKDVSLTIGEGEFVAILGANGSGKTTLARHFNGLLLPDHGKVLVNGLDTRVKGNLGAIRQTVGMVFQHPEDQIVASTVEEDVAFGPENLGMEPGQIRRRVDEAIRAVGLEAHRQRAPHMLSAGQMQRLALAGVLAMRPRCVVFDEATTMLDPAGRRMALELMGQLREGGLTVIFVTHNMEEAAGASRILVMQAGEVVFDGAPRAAFADARLESWGLELPPAAALAKQLRGCLPGLGPMGLTMDEFLATLPTWAGAEQTTRAIAGQDRPLGEVVIAVEGLEHTYMKDTPLAHVALAGVNLRVQSGRAHGLAGVTGSGKSTLLQHLNGLLRPQRGQVRVAGLNLADAKTLTRDVVKQVGLVFQNPETQFFETYVGDEIAYGPRQLGLDGSLRERVRRAMELTGLDFERFKDRFVYSLSGGEQRKVALACALAIEPHILLLDEPTAGLDPRSHHEILASLRQLQAEGVEMVVSSHRMEDLAELVQDLTVMRKGAVVMAGSAQQLFEEREPIYAAGLEQPAAVRAAVRLRELGWPVPPETVTPDQLEVALSSACQGGAA